ncbi:hypothetical protein D0469_09420 [Peribacillus saganii]|uniref:Uncharacterized protein n=1 Tax=Peribacillus saganii TaxID=2303992 RepID=A0A372LQZ5_9BACI|nr:hypothetical protein [Peribacillus saganii]RFU69432.1 hypothetical protein D0469_09420 [Peribacillus saganii]
MGCSKKKKRHSKKKNRCSSCSSCCCPPVTKHKEPSVCEQRRADFAAASPVELGNNFRLYFENTLVTSTVAQAPSHCDNLTGDPEFDLATEADLNNPFVRQELKARLTANGVVCSMVIHVVDADGNPALAKIKPGSKRFYKILPVKPVSCLATCLAFTLCVDNTP